MAGPGEFLDAQLIDVSTGIHNTILCSVTTPLGVDVSLRELVLLLIFVEILLGTMKCTMLLVHLSKLLLYILV